MVADGVVVEDLGLGEDGLIGLEGDQGSGLFGIADPLQVSHRVSAVFEAEEELAAIAADGDVDPFGKGVDDRGADAVEAAGYLIAAVPAELAAGVEDGVDGLDAG